MKNKKSIVLLFSMLSLLAVKIDLKKVLASSSKELFQGYSSLDNISNAQLEIETNTIEFSRKDYTSLTFDYSLTNVNYETDSAGITVITHGLGGDASGWSNQSHYGYTSNLEFIYDSNSVIEKLRKQTNGDVYLAKFSSKADFYLERLRDLSAEEEVAKEYYKNNNSLSSSILDSLKYENSAEYLTCLPSIDKHIIIVFQAFDPGSNNNFIYDQFNTMLDKVLYDYKKLNNDKLTRVNLISHSRGGITNLQYALDHPKLVNQMFSIATPFLGSKFGNSPVAQNIMQLNPNDPARGEHDILNEETYMSYQNRWNKYFDDLYSRIDFHTIGSYISLNYIYKFINSDTILPTLLNNLKLNPNNPNSNLNINDIRESVNFWSNIDHLIFSLYKIGLIKIENIITDPSLCELAKIAVSMIGIDRNDDAENNLSLYDDAFIDLDSQLGKGYKGIKEYRKKFKPNNTDTSKISTSNPAIGHNLECRDEEIITYILQNIFYNTSVSNHFVTFEKADGTLRIDNAYRIEQVNNTLTIPSMINGKVVSEINENAFENYRSLNSNDSINIYIPTSINKIGKKAFYNCTSVESITFESSSSLESIEEETFSGCNKLKSINLPSSVKKIYKNAFLSCSSLENITLPLSLRTLSGNVFIGCTNLKQLTISEANSTFATVNGVLYSKSMRYLKIYPSAREETSFTVPNEVITISKDAFLENEKLSSINLNNVTTIDNNSFFNCKNLQTINSYVLEKSDENALIGTKWFENKNDIVKLGKCLISYRGNSTEITTNDLAGIQYICTNAFSMTNVNKIVIPSQIKRIYQKAFINCKSLNEIVLLDDTKIYDNIVDTNSNAKIYVTNNLYDKYITNTSISKLRERFLKISTSVTITTPNKTYNETFYYGDEYTLPIVKQEGYTTYWLDENNKYYDSNGIWNCYEKNLVITANFDENVKFVDKNNNLLFDYNLQNGDNYSINNNDILINNKVVYTLQNPQKYYKYTFKIGEENSINGIYNNDFMSIKIEEIPIEYVVSIYKYHVGADNEVETVSFTCRDIANRGYKHFLPPIDANGIYDFEGFYLDENYTTKLDNLYLLIDNQIKYLYVNWTEKVYTVYYYNGDELLSIEKVKVTNSKYRLATINITKNYYYSNGWRKMDDNKIYDENVSFNPKDDVYFQINWIPITYNIFYENLMGASNSINPETYTYETAEIKLNNISKTNYNFLGWYSDVNFKNKITSIKTGSHGNIMLYAKWKINYTYRNNRTFTITDSPASENSYDKITLKDICNNVSDLIEYNYSTITVLINIDVWEKDDGYQKIYIYNKLNNGILLYETEIEHGRNKTDTTPKTYSFEFTINLSDLTSDNGFYIMYSARGFASDDWLNSNLKVNIIATQTKAYHEHKNIKYEWNDLTSHKSICYCGNETVEGHAVRSGGKTCVLCGGKVDMGFIIVDSIKSCKFVTRNGSYILPNGVIVLVDEDVEAYINGTLLFYNKDEEVS